MDEDFEYLDTPGLPKLSPKPGRVSSTSVSNACLGDSEEAVSLTGKVNRPATQALVINSSGQVCVSVGVNAATHKLAPFAYSIGPLSSDEMGRLITWDWTEKPRANWWLLHKILDRMAITAPCDLLTRLYGVLCSHFTGLVGDRIRTEGTRDASPTKNQEESHGLYTIVFGDMRFSYVDKQNKPDEVVKWMGDVVRVMQMRPTFNVSH